jgi:hypothetical protein
LNHSDSCMSNEKRDLHGYNKGRQTRFPIQIQ